MQGILDFLTGPSKSAKLLRRRFIFKIIPMLNIDGVIVGNYRCSLVGVDLNRRWLNPSQEKHPVVYFAKRMMEKVALMRRIVLYCDFHGHSKKRNVFLYGCTNRDDDPSQRLLPRVFPRILARVSPYVSFTDCAFGVHSSKLSTARVVIWKELGVVNSFTCETSFFGASNSRLLPSRLELDHYQLRYSASLPLSSSVLLSTTTNAAFGSNQDRHTMLTSAPNTELNTHTGTTESSAISRPLYYSLDDLVAIGLLFCEGILVYHHLDRVLRNATRSATLAASVLGESQNDPQSTMVSRNFTHRAMPFDSNEYIDSTEDTQDEQKDEDNLHVEQPLYPFEGGMMTLSDDDDDEMMQESISFFPNFQSPIDEEEIDHDAKRLLIRRNSQQFLVDELYGDLSDLKDQLTRQVKEADGEDDSAGKLFCLY